MKIFLLTLFLILSVSDAAHACMFTPEEIKELFIKQDSNSDGFIDIDEYSSMIESDEDNYTKSAEEIIAGHDKNSDHRISIEEYDPWAGQYMRPKCL